MGTHSSTVVSQYTRELLDLVSFCSFEALSQAFFDGAIGDFYLTVRLWVCHRSIKHLVVVDEGPVLHFVARELFTIICNDSEGFNTCKSSSIKRH